MYISDDFLLKNECAERLYHDYVCALPIIDYHNHLSPVDLGENRNFADFAELWVLHDPYKHRAMRIAGVPERLITGEASSRDKFNAWAATLPKTAGGPLYHWSALELKRFFNIDKSLDPESADAVWNEVNEKLTSPEYSACSLVDSCNVELLCTSDRLLDSLDQHKKISDSNWNTAVRPSLRGDDIIALDSPGYFQWLQQLGNAGGNPIVSYGDFCAVLNAQLDRFDLLGCKLADHALDDLDYIAVTQDECAGLFEKQLAEKALSSEEALKLKSGMLFWLASNYEDRGWTMQIHTGAQRFTSSRLRRLAGSSGGYASPGSCCDVSKLCAMLDDFEKNDSLPRTVLYTLNPADSAVFATLTGSYAEDGVRGKIQFGPAWWYNDHIMGMRQHLETLANYGMLSAFIGMTTDSRSLLSLSRHEYFRRLLCCTIAEWVNASILPDDFRLLEELLKGVCYTNAKEYLAI
ncbi:MAG: glucuronate isomerase [Kiritimatiellia bacterium]